jgi:Homeodomain-like domain
LAKNGIAKRRGRPTTYKAEYVEQTKKLCLLGATDEDIADFFNVSLRQFYKWKHWYPELTQALKIGKEEADNRVERSLYVRANGFHYDAVKIFCDKNGRVTKVPYREYVIPDVTAGIFWLKNRDPQHWRDSQ